MAVAAGRSAPGSLDRGAAAPLLAERSGLHLPSASVSALLTRQPAQVKLDTLAALCTALQCTPNDLFEVDTTPVAAAVRPERTRAEPKAARGRSMPPL